MAEKRDLMLEEYGVSQNAYRELLYFCRQHDEKKRAMENYYFIQVSIYKQRSIENKIDMSNEIKDAKAKTFAKDVDLIENAAKKVAPFYHKELLKNVTQGIPFEQLDVPYGRNQFFKERRKFFLEVYQVRYWGDISS